MQGRWTIHSRGWGHLVAPIDPKDVAPGSWPVVPCDDAAIERAREWFRNAGPHLTSYEIVTGILRAAGETP